MYESHCLSRPIYRNAEKEMAESLEKSEGALLASKTSLSA